MLERRKRVQREQQDEGQSRTPLEDVLLQRQQKRLQVPEPLLAGSFGPSLSFCSFVSEQKEKEEEEKKREEAQLMEFVRVRQNLRKIHSVIQDKSAKF